MLLRIAAGRRFICRVKLSSAVWAPMSRILQRTTKRVLRSTSVPTDDRLKAPLSRLPSQWPGMRRASISSGRWIIRNYSGTIALPVRVVRRRPRDGLAWRRASIIAAFSPPRGCARRIDRLVADAGARVIALHAPQSLRDLLRRPAPKDKVVMHEAVKRAAFGQLAPAPAARAPRIVGAARRLRSIAAIGPTAPRQLAPDRARQAGPEAARSPAGCGPVHARRRSRHVPRC
jgi:hypothetical protein